MKIWVRVRVVYENLSRKAWFSADVARGKSEDMVRKSSQKEDQDRSKVTRNAILTLYYIYNIEKHVIAYNF